MKISIITACYNSEATILGALNSLRSQEYANIEHILVDGASSDKTLEIIKNNKIENSVIISEPDNGIYEALNKGIRASSGDIIGFLHSDDLFYNNKILKKVADIFSQKGTDAVYGDLNYVSYADIGKTIRKWQTRDFDPDWFRYGWMPPHPTVFLKSNLYDRFGLFDESFKISGDYEFMLRLFYKENVCAVHSGEVKLLMRTGGISNRSLKSIYNKIKEDVSIMRRYELNAFTCLLLKNLSKLKQFT